MAVDIVSLVYSADATQLDKAEKAFDRLTAAATRHDAAERKRLTATERAGVTTHKAADAMTRATRAATDHARAQGAVEKATRDADRAAQQSLAFRMRLTAQQTREALAAAKAQASAQTAADRESERSAQQLLAFRMRMSKQRAAEEAAATRDALAAQKAADQAAAASAKAAAAAQAAADREAERSAQQLLQFRVRMARQRAAEEAASVGQAEAAQKAADRESERSAQQLLAFRVRMAKQRAAEEANAAREQAAAVASLEARIHTLKSSIDPAYAAQSRLDAEMKEAAALYKMGAISASDYAKAVGNLDAKMAEAARGHTMLNGVMVKGAGSAKFMQRAGLDLSRQFADIGVTAAMGMNPIMILIQQGPQIADVFAQAKMQGMGFSAVMKGLAGQLAPVLALLGPIVIAAGAAAGAFALLNRELSKDDPKNFAATLGLTEEQLKRVDTATITMGDTFKATLNVMADYLTSGPIGDAIDWLSKAWNNWLDEFAKNTAKEFAAVYGVIVGVSRTIAHNWRSLGAAMASGFAIELNKMIDQVQAFVNATVRGFNLIRPFISPALPVIPEVDLSGFKMEVSGAAEFFGMALKSNIEEATKDGARGISAIFGRIQSERREVAEARIRKEAGDANKTPKGPATPRDMSDERSAQIAALVEQAKRDELQATLAVTKDIRERAKIEREILAAEIAIKQSQIDRQIASIADDKGLDAAKKAELTFTLNGVKAQIAVTGLIQQRAVNENEALGLSKQAADLRAAELQNQREVLESQADLTRSSYARAVIELEILNLKQQEEALQQQALVDQLKLAGYSAAEVKAAEDKLAAMKIVHANELEIAKRSTTLAEAMRAAAGYVSDFKDAFRNNDFDGLLNALAATIQTIRASFKANGVMGGLVTTAGAVGGLVGGKGGKALMTGATYGVGAGALASGLGAVGGQMILAGGTGALGGLGMGLASFSAMLGPMAPIIGLVAGLVTLAKAFQKPSNKGAGYDLITGAISGKSRDEETEGAVIQAGDAILQAQEALKGFGLDLKTTIAGLTIGSRDQSQITTSDGRTLYAAKGDPAAAVEAALAAVLDGAKYVSDTQKALVESMRAAGKGFDDIATALQAYAQAQQMITAVNDEILRLTDPQKYDLQGVSRAYEEQQKAAKAAFEAGYITADQLTELNARLGVLNGLQIDEVMKRYAASVEDAAEAARRAAEEAAEAARREAEARNAAAIDVLREGLSRAYQAEKAALEENLGALRQFADSLRSYADQISGAMIATLSPGQQLGATSRRFQNIASLAAQGDRGAQGQFQGAAEAFRQASAQFSPDAKTNQRNLAAINRATEDALKAAESQVDIAEQQLAALDASVAGLLEINKSVLSVRDAILALKAGQKAVAAGEDPRQAAVVSLASSGPTAGAGDAFNAQAYLAANKDIGKAFAAGTYGADAYASVEEFARAHYMNTGQYEAALGFRNRGYASGTNSASPGWHWVGEEGPELMRFRGGEQVVPNHALGRGSNDNPETLAELRRQNALIADNTRQVKKLTDLMVRVTRDGDSLVTVAA